MNQECYCSICMQPLSGHSCALPCGHHYCESCIAQWYTSYNKCPDCGMEFTRVKEFINLRATGFFLSPKLMSNMFLVDIPFDNSSQLTNAQYPMPDEEMHQSYSKASEPIDFNQSPNTSPIRLTRFKGVLHVSPMAELNIRSG